MKFKKLDSWTYTDNLEGLLLFVQRLHELSFIHSDYLEKNIHTSIWEIISEYYEIIEHIEKDNLTYYNKELDIIYEELKSKIQKDKISTILLGDKIARYLEGINPKNKISFIKQSLEIINRKINPHQWFEIYKMEILEIVKDNKKKDIIIHNTNLLFEFLVYYGYQKNTIHHIINIYFYDKSQKNKINNCENILDFLNYFDLEFKSFDVYFQGSNFFKEIEESCSNFDIEIIEKQSAIYNTVKEKNFFKNKGDRKVFIKCNNVKAVDYYHAAKEAENVISLISDLFTIFSHKIKPWFSQESLVYHHKKDNVIMVKNFTNPMEKLRDNKLDDAKNLFPLFLSRFGLEKDSFNRFNRGVELHALSLSTKESASQILNLWICLETLLITETGSTHISIVEEYLKKIIVNDLLSSKINNLAFLFEHWNHDKFEEVISKLPTELNKTKGVAVASIFILKEYKDLAIDLLSKLDEVPLLRYKSSILIREFQNLNKLKAHINQAVKEIHWNIRRIYRTRNKIVHQGNTGILNDFIVESAHYYLDCILNSIILKKIKFNDINSIENYLHEVTLINTDYLQFIDKQKSVGVSKENFKKIFFGLDYD